MASEIHGAQALFYLFDEPTLLEHYEKLRSWANSLRQQVGGSCIAMDGQSNLYAIMRWRRG